jgi:hypothetical protein
MLAKRPTLRGGSFAKSRKNSPEVFDFAEKIFDQMWFLIKMLVDFSFFLAI